MFFLEHRPIKVVVVLSSTCEIRIGPNMSDENRSLYPVDGIFNPTGSGYNRWVPSKNYFVISG